MRQRLHNGPSSTPTATPTTSLENFDFLPIDGQTTTLPPPKIDDSKQHINNDSNWLPLSSNPTNQKLLKKQDVLMRAIYRKIAAIEQALDDNNSPMEFIKLKINQLSKEIQAIDELHIEIVVETEEEQQTTPYFRQNFYETLKDKVDTVLMRLQYSLKAETTKPSGETRVQLPTIQIPAFHGNYEQWSTFNDIFTDLIHNNNKLSNTTKMTYLKSNLHQGAAQLINHLTTTGDNYDKAWEILQTRYNNPRLLASKYFNSMLTLPSIHVASAAAIRVLHDTATEIIHNINKLGIKSPFEALVMFILGKKLDAETIRLYETTLEKPRELPQITEFFNFLEKRFQSLEAVGFTTKAHPQQQIAIPRRVHATTLNNQCLVKGCQGKHQIQDCNQFKLMPTLDRKKLVNKTNTCVRCLTQHTNSNSFKSCTSTIRCIVCQGNHHTLLHGNNMASSSQGATHSLTVNQQGTVLLPTAIVRVTTGTGQLTTLRALIDSGSQATLISSKAANILNIKKQKAHINISGIGQNEAGICKHTINIKLVPRFDGDFSLDIEALVFNKLTQQLPEVDIDTRAWSHLNNLKLADPNYNQSQPIDIILGADYYPLIIANSIIKGSHGEPMAQNTELGWIVIGNISNLNNQARTTMVTTKSIVDQLKLFVEIDSIPEERSHTEEENQVENLFKTTLKRHTDGRFIVKIPFKENHEELGESRKRASARLLQLEKRFTKDTKYKELYQQFIQEYIDLNQMELIQENQGTMKNIYYIPHHGVLKPDSTTTKLRVVFDASAKTTNGVSLNDIMMNGPKLQEDLADILLRWRKHKIVITADIEKMFRQVWLTPEDQNYHRILWRKEPSEEMKAYKLKTVTYGTTAANYLAVRALLEIADQGSNTHPIAAKIIMTDFYVDDLLTGADNIEEVLLALHQLQELTAQGGFHLRKWASNSPKVLQNISDEQQATGHIQIKLNECIKTLGILYNQAEDFFEFNISGLQLTNHKPTKRSLLSDSSKLFDPIGWLSPITIMAKIMMQDVWKTGINWDEQLPEKINNKWKNYKDDLKAISNIKIPRWVHITSRCKTELHGFADASEYAYAAVVYSRTVNDTGNITTHLLMSKTRVAPVKTKLSIPRLELNAALLLAKLIKHIQVTMKLGDIDTHAWSDSTITLCWIKGEPNRFKTFVANRISTIKKAVPTTKWHHVKSQENPADAASRGMTPTELIDNNLWWHGPPFLRAVSPQWNTEEGLSDIPPTLKTELEEKTVLMTVVNQPHAFSEIFNKVSIYNKIKRTVAYCLRFINNCRKRNITKDWLTSNELRIAETTILKLIQHQDFEKEIACITKEKMLNKNNKLASLNPFQDDQGLLRVMGRLQNSNLESSSKQPIILSKNNIITQRIIEDTHKKTLHGGIQLTLTILRQKYWIIDGRRAVRQVIQKCITCFRHGQKHMEQLMGVLPPSRVRPGRPFAKTGIDYAGPIQLRTTKGRGHKSYKGYIALFICMATRAVHIEIVSSLTTEAFMAAYKRFVSRRGLCTDVFSDNGTYFVGANTTIKKSYHAALTTLPDDIASMLANDGTNWHFIPPHTPHFGGIWEAGIKSIKFHLKRVIGESTLTFEELYTLITQIEAVLNSRPLTPLTNDASDTTALTPGHFLVGDSLKAIPEPDNNNMGLRTRWHMVEKMTQEFWKRWSSEYLHQLQQRVKWRTIHPNLAANDLVLVKDDQLPVSRWKLGRILDTHAGKDNLVRIATVKCNDATYKRPITKLCKLPIDDSKETSFMRPIASTKDATTSDASKTLPRQQPYRRAKTIGKMNHLAIAMFSICCLFGFVSTTIEIKPFNQSTGIYFESLGKLEIVAMEWTLAIHYNMSSYWEEIRNYKVAHNEIHAACKELSGLNCNILEQLQWQFSNLIADNDLLLASNKEKQRVKRGFGDSTGIVLGDMFGILTQREASIYETRFEEVSNNEHLLLSLIRNQTTLIDNTVKMMKHNSNLTATSINNLIKRQDQLRREITELQEYRTYEDRVRSVLVGFLELSLVLNNLRDTQQGLLDLVYDMHHGILHPSILVPSQLEEQLQLIRQHVPASITIPGHNIHDLVHIYQIMKIRSRLTQRGIIIEITLPLSFTWDYTLLSVVSIPNIHHDHTESRIITSTEYLAIDDRREHFATMTRDEVDHCQKFKPTQFLCEISPIVNAPHNQGLCEVAIMQRNNNLHTVCRSKTTNATNHWIKLHASNQWIYVVPRETTVDVICNQEIQPYTFKNSGLIKIEPGCMLRDAESLIIAAGITRSNMTQTFHTSQRMLFEGNHLKNLSSFIRNNTRLSSPLELITTPATDDIENQIATLEKTEDILSNQSFHHMHHYSMTHISFWSIVIIGIIWIIRRRQKTVATIAPLAPLPLVSEDPV